MRISPKIAQIILLTGSALLLVGGLGLRLTGEGFLKDPMAILLIIWAIINICRAIPELIRLNRAKKTEINTTITK